MIRNINYSCQPESLQLLNLYSNQYNEYTPLLKGGLNRGLADKLFRTVPELIYVKSKWRANVGANGINIVVNFEKGGENKVSLKKKTYSFLFDFLKWQEVESKCIEMVAMYGNAVVWFDEKNNSFKIKHTEDFNIYFDQKSGLKRFALLEHGVEVAGKQNLYEGKDVVHIKDPAWIASHISPSRLDAVFAPIVLRNNGVRANSRIFDAGFIGSVILKPRQDAESNRLLDDKNITGTDGKTNMQRALERVREFFGGVSKANRAGIIPWLEDIKEIGKSNTEMQFTEILRNYVPEQIAWAYSLVLADFGSGNNLTYNNANTFDAALYDKFGRPFEYQLSNLMNWMLKKSGISIDFNFYAEYIPPQDPNRLKENEDKRKQWDADLITLNEWREWMGYDPIEGGDVTKTHWNKEKQENTESKQGFAKDTTVTDTLVKKDKKRLENANTQDKIEPSPTENALKSDEYIKFEERVQKALEKQINEYISYTLEKKQINPIVKLKKLESFYDFKTLKRDLLTMAQKGVDLFYSDPFVKAKHNKQKKFADDLVFGEPTKEVLEYFDKRTESLLKGSSEFKSLDVQTSAQIEQIIKENIEKPLEQIMQILTNNIADLTITRAKLIAETETANALEGARWLMYKTEFTGGLKEWFTVNDERVRHSHRNNQSEGKIPIEKAFSSGEMRAGEAPRCRCSVNYYPPKDYLDK